MFIEYVVCSTDIHAREEGLDYFDRIINLFNLVYGESSFSRSDALDISGSANVVEPFIYDIDLAYLDLTLILPLMKDFYEAFKEDSGLPFHLMASKYSWDQSQFDQSKQDMFQKSPLIYAIMDSVSVSEISNHPGLKKPYLNLRDQNGLTPLHYTVDLKSSSDGDNFYKYLIDKGADLNLTDYCGATPIMHAAAKGLTSAFEKLLPLYTKSDELFGELVNIASKNGHKQMVKIIEKQRMSYEEYQSKYQEIDDIKDKMRCNHFRLQPSKLVCNLDFPTCLTDCIKIARLEKRLGISALQNFLNMENDMELAEENQMILNEVTTLCDRIANKINSEHKEVTFMLSGSQSEGTKISCFDEFDFLCKLELLSSQFQDTTVVNVDGFSSDSKIDYTGFVKLMPTSDDGQDNYLCPYFISVKLLSSIYEAMLEKDTWKELHLSPCTEIKGGFISTIGLYWTGKNFKNIRISIDFVPTIVLKRPIQQSDELSRLVEKFPSIGDSLNEILLVAKRLPGNIKQHLKTRKGWCEWRYSFSHVETKIFQLLPNNARDGYKIIKFLKEKYFQSFPSYYFKICLFHVFLGDLHSQQGLFEEVDEKTWAMKILIRLLLQETIHGRIKDFCTDRYITESDQAGHLKKFCEFGIDWLCTPWS